MVWPFLKKSGGSGDSLTQSIAAAAAPASHASPVTAATTCRRNKRVYAIDGAKNAKAAVAYESARDAIAEATRVEMLGGSRTHVEVRSLEVVPRSHPIQHSDEDESDEEEEVDLTARLPIEQLDLAVREEILKQRSEFEAGVEDVKEAWTSMRSDFKELVDRCEYAKSSAEAAYYDHDPAMKHPATLSSFVADMDRRVEVARRSLEDRGRRLVAASKMCERAGVTFEDVALDRDRFL